MGNDSWRRLMAKSNKPVTIPLLPVRKKIEKRVDGFAILSK
jgi:hypothetical protein